MTQEIITTTPEELRDRYIRWHVMHAEERALNNLPLSPEEFSERFNISLVDIRSIHMSPTFADDVFTATQRWAKLKSVEMVHSLVENYKRSKNPKEFDSYVHFIESLKQPAGALSGNQINFFNISPQQYEQILKRESKRYSGDSSVSEESSSGQPDELLSVS